MRAVQTLRVRRPSQNLGVRENLRHSNQFCCWEHFLSSYRVTPRVHLSLCVLGCITTLSFSCREQKAKKAEMENQVPLESR